ncbi:MAG: DUF1844 domain-containing protein [Thermoguttaceae bacterium]|nr:DUF1844 domain-containing protein [Thermoguttaceae bacterium]
MSEDNSKDTCGCDHEHTGDCGCGCDHEHTGDCGCGCGHEHAGECGCGDASQNEEIDYSKYDVELPKPTLIMIATTLAQQAMVSMGILPNPTTGKSVFLMHQATYLIDSIDVLFQKTEGNRTEDETRTISNIMSELRMLYVKASEEKSRRDAAKKS